MRAPSKYVLESIKTHSVWFIASTWAASLIQDQVHLLLCRTWVMARDRAAVWIFRWRN